ncbi:MAG: hypothetical protein CL902_01145 [Dehalococcoidia bacterium]|nr:hypothetical protein [Dehalococcoidia bacterium]
MTDHHHVLSDDHDVVVDEEGFRTAADGTILSENEDSDTAGSLVDFIVDESEDEPNPSQQETEPQTVRDEVSDLLSDFPYDTALLHEDDRPGGLRRSRRTRRPTRRWIDEVSMDGENQGFIDNDDPTTPDRTPGEDASSDGTYNDDGSSAGCDDDDGSDSENSY